MANLYSFSGFLLGDLSRTNLSGNPPSTANIGSGDQFDIAGTPAHSIIISDTAGETTLEGDPGGEVSNDAQNDQIAFIKDENGVVVIDGSEIYIESIFLFTINGQTFKGFQLEIVGTGEDFVVFPPGVPAGTVTVEFVDFTPNPDTVAYEEMTSGDEEIDDADFTNLNSAGSDSIVAGAGDDTINAEGGADTIEAGAGNDDISAGGGGDVVLAGEGDDTVSAGAGADSVLGGQGDDVITGEAGNDTLVGGLGDDTIDGGDNNDLISGDEQEEIRVDLSLNWKFAPDPDNGGVIDSGDDISNGEIGTGDANFTTSFSQETGGITATVSFRDDGQATEFEFDDDDNVVTGLGAENEVANVESSLFLGGAGLGDTSTTRIEFSSTDGTFLDEVENVSFRVNDIDDAGWRDTVRISAFDADDNPITVNLTAGGNITLTNTDGVAGNDTATANNGTGNVNPDDAAGSLLVEIPGPVARIEIDYGNLETDGQRINVTDIFFQAVRDAGADVEGDDLLSGGAGADTISGNGGDDTIDGGTGSDSLTGGDGFDDFIVSAGADELTDFSQDPDQVLNDGDQDNNDFIDLDPFYDNYFEARADLADDGLLNQSNALDTKGRAVDYNDNTALPGTIAMTGTNTDDLFFDNTNIVCFASGAMIRTPEGERPVEQIRVGDLVDTRDHGPQPVRWVGARALSAEALNAQPRLRPVVISAGALGNARTLRVSPQHRMLVKSWRAEMLFGVAEVLAKAIDLVDGDRIWQADEGAVTYHHILFDQHEIIFAEGAECESLYPGDQALDALDEDARDEILALFPELATARRAVARQPLKGHEARALSQL